MLGGLFRKKADKAAGSGASGSTRSLGPDDPPEAEINERFLKLLVRAPRRARRTRLTHPAVRRINSRCRTTPAKRCSTSRPRPS